MMKVKMKLILAEGLYTFILLYYIVYISNSIIVYIHSSSIIVYKSNIV